MVRKISKERYVVTGIITLLIFLLGFALGLIIDNARVKILENTGKELEISTKSIQFQFLYLSSLKETSDNCNVLQVALHKTINDLSKTLDIIEKNKKETTLNGDSFNLISRQYLNENLQYWLFAQKSKEVCDMDVVTVLYFFSDKCPTCSDQGVILTYYKKKLQDKLLVFPINVDLESSEPIITILKTKYNITKYPAVVIEDKTYEGVISSEKMGEILNTYYKAKIE